MVEISFGVEKSAYSDHLRIQQNGVYLADLAVCKLEAALTSSDF
jgi:hypothetical protein